MPETLLPIPPSENFGYVKGMFGVAYGDSGEDANREPDYSPNGGKVVFTPYEEMSVISEPSMFLWRKSVTCTIDPSTGLLVDEAGYVGNVKLWVGNWTASFSLDYGVRKPFPFTLMETHTDEFPLDLIQAMPTPPPAGTIVQMISVPAPTVGGVLTSTLSGLAWVVLLSSADRTNLDNLSGINTGDAYGFTVVLQDTGWVSNSQTVVAAGVDITDLVLVSPVPLQIEEYATARVVCTEQDLDSLTFMCTNIPTIDLDVQVVIL